MRVGGAQNGGWRGGGGGVGGIGGTRVFGGHRNQQYGTCRKKGANSHSVVSGGWGEVRREINRGKTCAAGMVQGETTWSRTTAGEGEERCRSMEAMLGNVLGKKKK